MSRVCEPTGKKPMVGHTVSHSNIKTKRRYLPNWSMFEWLARSCVGFTSRVGTRPLPWR